MAFTGFQAHSPVTHKAYSISQAQLDAFHTAYENNHLPKDSEFKALGLDMPLVEAMQTAYQRLHSNLVSPWSVTAHKQNMTPEKLTEEMALGPLETNYWRYDEGFLKFMFVEEVEKGNKAVIYFVTSLDGETAQIDRITFTTGNSVKHKVNKEIHLNPFYAKVFPGRKVSLGKGLSKDEVNAILYKEIKLRDRTMTLHEIEFAFGASNNRIPSEPYLQQIFDAVNALPWWSAAENDCSLPTAPASSDLLVEDTKDSATKKPAAPIQDDYQEYMVDAIRGDLITIVKWPSMADPQTVPLLKRNTKLAPAQIIEAAVANERLIIRTM